jgi:hypothetical protein
MLVFAATSIFSHSRIEYGNWMFKKKHKLSQTLVENQGKYFFSFSRRSFNLTILFLGEPKTAPFSKKDICTVRISLMATLLALILIVLLMYTNANDSLDTVIFRVFLFKTVFVVIVPLLTIGRNQNIKNHLYNKYFGSIKHETILGK